MSRRGQNRPRKYGRNNPAVGDKAREYVENMDENHRTIKMFKEFAACLDDKHDRYERLVKMSRDITIESKRIIFLLHNVNTDLEEKKQSILEEASTRLNSLVSKNFKTLAMELKGLDAYQYLRAFTPGIQEFVEALCFYKYLKNREIEPWNAVNESFAYKDEDTPEYNLLFSQYDYILGIADFTGEMMRRCINNLGIGNITECYDLCDFVKDINTGFLGLTLTGQREISRKAYVLRQSLTKMEMVCYNIKIRGSEVPKHMLLSVIESKDVADDEDEGYF